MHCLYKNRFGRVLLLITLLMLGACATQPQEKPKPPALLLPGSEIHLADVDVLAVSPEMEAFLERYILKTTNMRSRMNQLMSAVDRNGVLGFVYNESLTLTATEAFERRTGNCIGFANMMIALARRSGLKATYQEVFRKPEWSSHEDTVLLIKHINVVLETRRYSYIVDVSGIKVGSTTRRRLTRDNYAKALYLSNIGAEALLDNQLLKAHAYLSKAIETETQIADPWVNLGVVYGRNDQLDDAAFAFNRALEIDPSEYAAMSNLYEVYLAQEDMEAAATLQAKVDQYRGNNPYYLLKLSDEALEQARFEESISLLQRAIRKKKNDHVLHFALAKTQYLSGETAAAEGSVMRARELAPENMLAHYGRPLGELVVEENSLVDKAQP